MMRRKWTILFTASIISLLWCPWVTPFSTCCLLVVPNTNRHTRIATLLHADPKAAPQSHEPLLLLEEDDVTTQRVSSSFSNATTACTTDNSTTTTNQEEVERYQAASSQILQSFVPTPFQPKINNPHVQTIAGVFLRPNPSACYIPRNVSVTQHLVRHGSSWMQTWRRHDESNNNNNTGRFWDDRQRVTTPDQDFFDVDYKYCCDNNDTSGLVLLVHGLQTSSNSSLCIDLARAYNGVGLNVACVHFRGCSGEPNRSLKAYHLGYTDDLKYYLEWLQQSTTLKTKKKLPIYLSGFSLGANVVVRALGELGPDAIKKYNIYGAAVNCLPLDNAKNHAQLVRPGINRLIYNRFLTASLKATSLQQLDRFPNSTEAQKIDRSKVQAAQVVGEVEAAVICPVWGYADTLDYYYRSSCLRTIRNVCVPVFVLQSLDDPFFDPSNDFPKIPSLRLVATRHGGHCGYLFQTGSSQNTSFVGWQLAQFLQHAQQSKVLLDRCKHLYFWQTSGFRG